MTGHKLEQRFLAEIKNKNLEKVKELLPKINIYIIQIGDPYETDNILMYALEEGAKEIYEHLVSIINVDYGYIHDEHGTIKTILTATSSYILYEILCVNNDTITNADINLLFSRTKDINKKCLNGDTLLHKITEFVRLYHDEIVENDTFNNYCDILKLCLEYGADPYIKNNLNKSSFDEVFLAKEYSSDIIKILLNNKYNKSIDVSMLTHAAILSKYHDIYDFLDLLLPYVTDINEPSKYGKTILQIIKEYEDKSDIIELLEAYGALPLKR